MNIAQVREIKERHATSLLAYPNVVGVGIGSEEGSPVIAVFVHEKVPIESLSSEDLLPGEVDGVKVKVVESGLISGY